MKLAHANQQNQAMAIARSLKVDMADLFIHLTNQYVRLTRNPGSILYARSIFILSIVNLSSRLEDTSGRLLTDSVLSWQGSPSDRGWRYLQQAFKRHDSVKTDHRYAKASLETMYHLFLLTFYRVFWYSNYYIGS
jgi:nuclear pore complex protein Nup160